MAISYKDSGVDVTKGYDAVEKMKKHTKATFDKNVLGDLGSFGGFYSIKDFITGDPVLVSGTDGVGTKLKYAFNLEKHDTIGIDCVAMCANDVVCQGAKPLFFLDYFAVGSLDPNVAATVVGGVAEGCKQAGCALIGGETAEMPGFYAKGEYDLAGFCVGIVDKAKIINGSKIKEGNVLVGFKSSGVHSNGFSLVRRLLGETKEELERVGKENSIDLVNEILTPTKMYVKNVLLLAESFNILGIAHITGGGFIENIPRILPSGLCAEVNLNSYEPAPIFKVLKKLSGLSNNELYNTFNMGVGMVLCVEKDIAEQFVNAACALGEEAFILGKVVKGEGVKLA